ncbi:hypothetical protein VNO80_30681 [Phaseolus coccineus]|uniref:Uncharacterized protein n=1 Tax=Phaseolus coccineus TaxID=3886 RepID=A0AAN9LDD7_PHACN
MSLALAMSACLSRPGDARMSRALAMPACLSRPGDARMPRALAMSVCLSRPGDARMPRALAIKLCSSIGTFTPSSAKPTPLPFHNHCPVQNLQVFSALMGLVLA